MHYTNYKKITYILSEQPGLSGQIAFEFIKKIISSKIILKITFYGHGINNDNLVLLKEMYNDIVMLPSKNNEEEFIINNFEINNGLLKVLCSLGEFPNVLKISKIDSNLKLNKIDYWWCIEYSDEVFTFIYADKFIDDSQIKSIEQELLNKGIVYERKVIRNVNF